jgi:hypothetical protein
MDGKFLGLGITNLFLIFLLFTVFSLIAKVVFTKYPVEGVSQLFQAS